MRAISSTASLLAATAIWMVPTAAVAGETGITSTDSAQISNPLGNTIQGDKKGVYGLGPQLNLDNAGTIRGNGLNGSVFDSDGGIILSGGPGNIINSGNISGARFGISTIYFTNPDNSKVGLAINSSVSNSGSIIGENDDGIRLIGGGSVVNRGLISGRGGGGADGISMFAYDGQDRTGNSYDKSYIGGVINLVGASIDGKRWGIILSGGGGVNNSGTINGGASGAVLIEGGVVFSNLERGFLQNSGVINGNVRLLGLGGSEFNNFGTITGGAAGSAILTDGPMVLFNTKTGSITGSASGIFSSGSTLSIDNAGTIRGKGLQGGIINPDAGVVITGGPAAITNSGTISGARFGITTAFFSDPVTNAASGRAIGTTVDNSGSIIGDRDKGIRLVGGGTVTNSGYIAGRVGAGADGIAMFAFGDQPTSGFTSIGTVNNLLGGTIEGFRFGIIQSSGGTINNAGTISGGAGGIVIQALDAGKIGTVTNSGTVNGTIQFNQLDSANVDNSGAISSTTGKGITTSSPSGALVILNRASGSITGATEGIYSEGTSLSVDNAGTILGNGTSTSFRTPGGGVVITGGPSAITNSGTISGARFGITTAFFSDPVTNAASGRAVGTTVSNSGLIIGDNDDGVRLIGGGTVTNSGNIAGRDAGDVFTITATPHSDGISMFAFDDQSTSGMTGIGSVNNLAGGQIRGNRFGVVLSGGGSVSNSGLILGYLGGGVLIQAQGIETGRIGSVTNAAGAQIWGGVTFQGLSSASVVNSGQIDGVGGTQLVAGVHSLDPLTLTNAATGYIEGSSDGVRSDGASLSLNNSGSILGLGNATSVSGPNGGIIVTGGPAAVTNSGSIEGWATGISTATYTDAATGQISGRAIGTSIVNTGSIIGDNEDGVRLMGGGTVTNSGYIAGRIGIGADGIYMSTFAGQDMTGKTGIGTATNLAGGVIEGARYGIVLLGGGTINNAGTISGVNGSGTYIQGGSPDRVGTLINSGTINNGAQFVNLASASSNNSGTVNGVMNFLNVSDVILTNSGIISGTAGFVNATTAKMTNSGSVGAFTYFNNVVSANLANSGTLNDYVSFSGVSNASLTNSGSISAATTDAIGSTSRLTVTNAASATITGSVNGISDHGPGLAVNNAGTIRGMRDSGISADGGPSTITNSGTIYGRFSAIYLGDPAIAGSSVDNSGSILSDAGGAMTLLGGGSVTNSGLIAGHLGIEMPSPGSISNLPGGVIRGPFAALYLPSGGSVNNAGTIDGTVSFGAGAFVPGVASTLTNSGTINGLVAFAIAGNIVNSGTIGNGSKGLSVAGPATFVNSGTINGGTGIAVTLGSSGDAVTLLTGSSISGEVDGGAGTDTLTLSGTKNSATPLQTVGQFLNFETLNVLGGYWTAPTTTGIFNSTTVSGGTFAVNGSITSPIAVNAGATLAGTGMILGNVSIASGGTFSPGNSIGTINVTGNVLFALGSTFNVQTTPNGTSDLLAVNGAVTINTGATLQVLAGIAIYPAAGTAYTILTATGGLSGKFDKAVTDYNYFNVSVNYQKKGTVTLNLTPNGKPLPSAATATTFSTATAINSLGATNPLYLAVLNQSLNGARQAFSSLSGSSYGRLDALMASDFGHLQLSVARAGTSDAGIEWSSVSSLSARGFHSESSTRRGPISLMLVGGQFDNRLATESLAADVHTRFMASAVGYQSGRFNAFASATAAWHDVSASRAISFPGFNANNGSRYRAATHRVDVESSYALAKGTLNLAPYGGYSQIMINSSGFQESGGLSALTFERESRSINQVRFGVQARGDFRWGKSTLSPHMDVSAQRAWGDLGSAKVARFVGGSENFDSFGSALSSRQIAVDAGVDLTNGPITVAASYRGQFGNQWRDHSAMLSAGFRF